MNITSILIFGVRLQNLENPNQVIYKFEASQATYELELGTELE
jgi:hypothetical protein